MNWTFINEEVVYELTTGFRLWLVRGSWHDPQEIDPIIPDGIDALNSTRLIRYGIAFAKTHYGAYCQDLEAA